MCDSGIVSVGGAGWLSFPNINGEEVKIQGTDKFADYLKNNKEDFEYLKSLLNE